MGGGLTSAWEPVELLAVEHLRLIIHYNIHRSMVGRNIILIMDIFFVHSIPLRMSNGIALTHQVVF